MHPGRFGRGLSRFIPLLLLAVLLLAACVSIPEPDSPGGKLYTRRCAEGCHGAYRPQSLKFEMWKIVVKRMQGEIVRSGRPPLSEEEKTMLLDYLRRHSS